MVLKLWCEGFIRIHNGPFAVELSLGTISPNWRENDALRDVSVRHLLSSLAALYHVIAQLQLGKFGMKQVHKG